jgi:hypothetical protein
LTSLLLLLLVLMYVLLAGRGRGRNSRRRSRTATAAAAVGHGSGEGVLRTKQRDGGDDERGHSYRCVVLLDAACRPCMLLAWWLVEV